MSDKTGMSQYEALGVDPNKERVRRVFSGAVDNDFPGLWVNAIRDPYHSGEVITQHMDGDGSKSLIRLLLYRVTEDLGYIKGMVDDAVSMNTGDAAAAGFVGPQTWTDVLNINGKNVDKDAVIGAIRERFVELRALYQSHGIDARWLGGETADLVLQVGSSTFDVAVHAFTREERLIRGNVQPGDVIWGFRSDDQAAWEDGSNSGIMSNGLTMAQQTLDPRYVLRYPELFLSKEAYTGHLDLFEGLSREMVLGDALTSPTRHWAILIRNLVDKLSEGNGRAFDLLHGISMNTGGGATKIRNLGTGGITYRKHMPAPPVIFTRIQEVSGEQWHHMYRTFNCGIGLDVIGHTALEDYLQAVSEETGVKLLRLGKCVENDDPDRNRVELETVNGNFFY